MDIKNIDSNNKYELIKLESINEYEKPIVNVVEPAELAVPAALAVAAVGGFVGGFMGQAITNLMK